jgi:hypothetical protein
MHATLTVSTSQEERFVISTSYNEESVRRVREKEDEFLGRLNTLQRDLYKKLVWPALLPDLVPYEGRRFPQFDVDLIKRWVIKRVYEYGWTKTLFPNDQSHDYSGRERPRVERIGKKYQWLALFELLARLTDNVWVIGGWPNEARVYDHPATDWFVRNVEPSLLGDPKTSFGGSNWWQNVPLSLESIDDDQLRSWPFSNRLPYTTAWLDVTMPDGARGFLLYGFFNSNEERNKESIRAITLKRDIFVRVSTILVDADQANNVIAKLQGCRLADPNGHENIEWPDGPFLCEYPWRNTWNSDYGVFSQRWIQSMRSKSLDRAEVAATPEY